MIEFEASNAVVGLRRSSRLGSAQVELASSGPVSVQPHAASSALGLRVQLLRCERSIRESSCLGEPAVLAAAPTATASCQRGMSGLLIARIDRLTSPPAAHCSRPALPVAIFSTF